MRRPAGGSAAPAAAAAAPSARYERLQHRLHSVGLQAYGNWADWASAGLSAALAAGLAADHTLAADAPLRSWEETVIGGGTDAAAAAAAAADLADASLDAPGGGLEMRFQLPAAPSPAAVQLALAACQEADRAGRWLLLLCCAPGLYGKRAPGGPAQSVVLPAHLLPACLFAGGHLLEEEPLLLLKWRLGGSLLAALVAMLAEGGGGKLAGGKLSEKGVLQLLFDARFLLDLLSGGRPVSTGGDAAASSTATAAVAARRREVAQLESTLSGRLDPIDWATYEPYLYGNKERAAARCQVRHPLVFVWACQREMQQRAGRQAGRQRAAFGALLNQLHLHDCPACRFCLACC